MHTSTSPIAEARRSFKAMLTEPIEHSCLATLFWFHGSGGKLIDSVRQHIVEMDGQLWWRFLDFDAWPLRMTRMVDPRYGSNSAELWAAELYKTTACCLDDHMSLTSRDLFGTYIEMSSGAEFIAMVRA